MKKYFLFLILGANSSAYSFVTVGTDPSCDYEPSSLQFALQTNDEVRVTHQVIFEPLEIINRSVTLIGGYDTCDDAVSDAQRFHETEISGDNSSTVLSISTTAAGGHLRQTIIIDKFKLINGLTSGFNISGGLNIKGNVDVTVIDTEIINNTASSHGGGIHIYGGDGADVFLDNVNVEDNNAEVGGGMSISNAEVTMDRGFFRDNHATSSGGGISLSGNSNLNVIDSLIQSNISDINGGGISCNNSHLFMDRDSRLEHNSARFGGGLYAFIGCEALIENGDAGEGFNTINGINVNSAEVFGGGVYAQGSNVTLKGSDTHYLNMRYNSTDENEIQAEGGAIYAQGDDTTVHLINGRLLGNSSIRGAAIAAVHGAKVKVMRTPGSCFNDEKCSLITDNRSTFGTIYTNFCGTVDVFQTTLSDNTASNSVVALLNGNNSDICENTFEGNLIYLNKDEFDESNALFVLDKGATLNFGFNTITDNLTNKIFHLSSSNGSSQQLNFNSSIIWNSPSEVFSETSDSNSYSGNCFLLHSLQNLPDGFGNLKLAVDPVFQNTANYDYQLSFESPPIDSCDTSLYSPIHHDIISTPRGVQIAPPVLGFYDMGAYEFDDGTHINDVIYYQSFD